MLLEYRRGNSDKFYRCNLKINFSLSGISFPVYLGNLDRLSALTPIRDHHYFACRLANAIDQEIAPGTFTQLCQGTGMSLNEFYEAMCQALERDQEIDYLPDVHYGRNGTNGQHKTYPGAASTLPPWSRLYHCIQVLRTKANQKINKGYLIINTGIDRGTGQRFTQESPEEKARKQELVESEARETLAEVSELFAPSEQVWML